MGEIKEIFSSKLQPLPLDDCGEGESVLPYLSAVFGESYFFIFAKGYNVWSLPISQNNPRFFECLPDSSDKEPQRLLRRGSTRNNISRLLETEPVTNSFGLACVICSFYRPTWENISTGHKGTFGVSSYQQNLNSSSGSIDITHENQGRCIPRYCRH